MLSRAVGRLGLVVFCFACLGAAAVVVLRPRWIEPRSTVVAVATASAAFAAAVLLVAERRRRREDEAGDSAIDVQPEWEAACLAATVSGDWSDRGRDVVDEAPAPQPAASAAVEPPSNRTELVLEIERLVAERDAAREEARAAHGRRVTAEDEAAALRRGAAAMRARLGGADAGGKTPAEAARRIEELQRQCGQLSQAVRENAALVARIAVLEAGAVDAATRVAASSRTSEEAERARAEAQTRHEAEMKKVRATLDAETTSLRERSAAAESDHRRAVENAEARVASLVRAQTESAALIETLRAERDQAARHAREVESRLDATARASEETERGLSEARARHDAALTELRTRLASETASLRERAESAEDAVRAVLAELGVEPSSGPLTTATVIRAVGPLTLFALGESTPGWTPTAPEDTLAAAVVSLAERCIEQRRQIEHISAALARAEARRPTIAAA